ncbi:MAG: B12-binding domain-containing radical SAM protein [Proteobacteria bacterium]|nr:B12-binding domain-containing radical SAM protein [Pseudomonadota bacterium]
MRIAFLQDIWDEIQGTLILAEILERQGHDVRFFLQERGWWRKLVAFAPEMAAIHCTSLNVGWVLAVSSRLKELPAPPLVVLGGAHPTFAPEIVEHPAVDAVCRGEGELGFPELVNRCRAGELPTDVPNFRVKAGGVVHDNPLGPLVRDLDSHPIPRRSLYMDYPFLGNSPTKRVITGRGCPFSCTFCANRKYRELYRGLGPYVRRRSVGHVMEELQYLARAWNTRVFDFSDDIFTLDKKWFAEFVDTYSRDLRLPYFVISHARHMDEEVVEGLAASGCFCVLFGVESGSPRVREEIMKKNLDEEDIVRCAALLRKHGIQYKTQNVLGMPTETLEEAFETVRVNRRIKPWYPCASIAQPYPGTRLLDMSRDMGLLTGDPVGRSFYGSSVIAHPDARALANLQRLFYAAVRWPGAEPLIRRLIRLPPNRAFDLFHQFTFGWHVKKRNRYGFTHSLRMYLKYLGQFD